MVEDITATWRNPKATGWGVYVLRGRHEAFHDIVRVGVAGIRNGKNGMFGRLDRHTRPPTGAATVGTHECQPFDVIRAWTLPEWSPGELESAEQCLYRAFAVRFRRRTVGLPDKSLFVVPVDRITDLNQALDEIDLDLRRIDNLRPV
jgi:hypothetical protein